MRTWSTADIPSQSGRVAVVTGGNGGLGLASSVALAHAGAHVVIAARDLAKADDAVATITSQVPEASLEVVPLDLADLASVHAAAEQIAAAHPAIDILMNNAGVMAIPRRLTADGFEMQFGVNHLGHWALTALLLGPLVAADAGRVVSVSSTAHHMGRSVDPADPHLEKGYQPWQAYGRSKLANYHFAIGLQRRFGAANVSTTSILAHPGLSNTDLQTTTVAEGGGGPMGRISAAMSSIIGSSAENGALSQLRAATDPGARGGQFYGPLLGNNGPPVARPILRRIGMDDSIARLWRMSAELTGLSLDVDDIRRAVPA